MHIKECDAHEETNTTCREILRMLQTRLRKFLKGGKQKDVEKGGSLVFYKYVGFGKEKLSIWFQKKSLVRETSDYAM